MNQDLIDEMVAVAKDLESGQQGQQLSDDDKKGDAVLMLIAEVRLLRKAVERSQVAAE